MLGIEQRKVLMQCVPALVCSGIPFLPAASPSVYSVTRAYPVCVSGHQGACELTQVFTAVELILPYLQLLVHFGPSFVCTTFYGHSCCSLGNALYHMHKQCYLLSEWLFCPMEYSLTYTI